MKKLVLIPLLFVACWAQAQEMIRKSAVPPAVLEEFDARFIDIDNIVWLQASNELYLAQFEIKDMKAQAVFQANGQWLETEQAIAYLEMPDSARNYCRGNYPNYQAKEIQKVSTRKYGILYEIKMVGEGLRRELTFDMHGALVDSKEINLEQEALGASETEEPASIKDKMGKLFGKKERNIGE